MSYARSPRPLCSITIGIKPSPLGSSALSLLIRLLTRLNCPPFEAAAGASRRRRLHQCRKLRRLIIHLGALQCPVDDVAFDRPDLVFVQPVGLLVVPADHRIRLLEALRRLLDECADLLWTRLQPVLPDDLAQDQAEGNPL